MGKLKKIGILLLVVTLFSSTLLSGCKSKTDSENTNTDSTKTDAAKDGEKKKPVEISWYYPGEKQEDEQKVWDRINELLIEKANIKVDFKRLDWAAYDEQMKMAIAANEEFDICFTANWSNNFYNNVSKGAFLPLDDLLKKEVPDLMKALPEFLLTASEYQGEIYAIPNYQSIFTQWSLTVQKDLADKYGLDLEQFKTSTDIHEQMKMIEPFLQKIKENEKDLYPIEANGAYTQLVTEWIPGTNATIKSGSDELKVLTYEEMTEVLKPYRDLYREWFKKGYLRPDVATIKKEDRADKSNLKYAVWWEPYSPTTKSAAENKYKIGCEVIPVGIPFIAARAGDATMNAISRNSKHPEAAIKFLEILNTDKEIYNMLCFGIEGEHYKKVAENRIETVEDSKYFPNSSWMFGNVFNSYYVQGQDDGVWEATEKMNTESKVSPLRGFGADLSSIKNILPQVAAVSDEFRNIEFVYVDEQDKYDALLKEAKEKIEKAGYNEVVEELQKQIDEWSKNK